MNKVFKTLPAVLALAFAFTAGAAKADDQVFTQAPALSSTASVHLFNHQVGSFFDTFNFNVAGASVLSSSANNLQLSLYSMNILNVTGLSATLWDNHHPNGMNVLGTFAGNNSTYTFNLPLAGLYHLDITGNATGLAGGTYAVALSAAPVPEPESYAMLLAGLGLMGTIARRRSKSTTV